MPSRLRTALFILFACCMLHAEVVATLGRSAAGVPELRVRNNSSASLAAWAVAVNPASDAEDQTQFTLFTDTLIEKAVPLKAGDEQVVPVLKRSRPGKPIEDLFELPVITAAIQADGTKTGDAVLLTRLMTRRCNMLLAVETALEALSDAGNRNVAREQLVEQFRRLADSNWRWYMPPEQQVGRSLYQSIMERLKSLPVTATGSAFPPSAFVAQETAALNRERASLLESQPSLATATFARSR